MKRIPGFVAALALLAPTLALAEDISGNWRGWSCGVHDTYSCPETVGYFDNLSTLHFAANPKTGTNTATWDYRPISSYYCTSTLTYVSDFGGAVAGAYHYWTFTDVPQTGGCLPGTVVVVVKAGSTDPMQVFWYADDPTASDTNTFGYMTPLSRSL
ncbi:hypothetical protein POL68_11725 [Stigmatella sp. ncwal1]|uniref:Secreted protein n=1 Tax=Stigmatella ashevillensis TaxID=2995309 RepID=A0ABT5D649_9BACT|nr:hypothetical protein [Stigmatella ashevillena]MDC0709133.1 hypothetical protein [Stigmatella ashevillena]